VIGQAFVLLGTFGVLRPWSIALVGVLAMMLAAARARHSVLPICGFFSGREDSRCEPDEVRREKTGRPSPSHSVSLSLCGEDIARDDSPQRHRGTEEDGEGFRVFWLRLRRAAFRATLSPLRVARDLDRSEPRELLALTLFAVALIPAFLLTLHPPLAFDETMYHLPFIQHLATTGRIALTPGVRYAIFPQLHELLCVPMFLTLGDTAPPAER
jgi:hypothetical protein